MRDEIIKAIKPSKPVITTINNFPGDKIQSSVPKAINVPPPPKLKK